MTKKILALLLAILIVFSCFALTSCGEEEKKPDDKKDDKKEETQGDNHSDYNTEGEIHVTLKDDELEIPEDAKQICDGTTFTVFAPYPGGPDRFVREALNDSPVNDAIYNRNLALEDSLGVTVKSVDFNTYTDAQAQKIFEIISSGDHSFDVAAIHSTSACASLLMTHSALSFDYLEYCDLSKPWWIQNFNEQCSILDEDFFGISSACYSYYDSAACILFNKDIAEERNLPNLYDLVRKGEWTVDKMIELTKNFSEDLNGDGVYDENDRLAVVSDDHAYLNYWYGAFRQSTVEKGENDAPTVVAGSARMATVIDKLNNLFNSGKRGYIYPMGYRTKGDTRMTDAFAEGKILFYIGSASTATGLRDFDINFGIIPLPKLDKNQENYGSWVDPWHLTFCVPSDCVDPEKTSIILEAMSYYSYHMIYPALVEQQLFGSGTRDIESLEMLEKYIFPNIFFDFGYIYDGWGMGYSSLIRTLIPNKSSDIASYIAEKKNEADNHFSKVYDAMVDYVDSL